MADASCFFVVVSFSPTWRCLLAAISYGVVSMAMVFINKAILMKYSYSMMLLTVQQLATGLLIHLGRALGFTKVSSMNLATAKKLLPISLFYNANVAFALASLKGVNIPMYIALKRLTPLAVLVAGFFSGKGRPPIQLWAFFELTMFFCTIVNSALTTTIVGVLKGVGSTTPTDLSCCGVEVHLLNVIDRSITRRWSEY
ncbi:hypothetical protein HPP92_015840 [Vanilla planifolia]|uniref:Uncharacterized protein n=1 Tax=Vanilla planifolia TaxID=51239 RepID=A0A835QLY4_VANPL|nr:hypothetical protein HPP92_015840 [Vanilla planifolia]